MKTKWNERYSGNEYYFGKEPNEFFKEQIEKAAPGKALFLGDGEGRNSVYAAKLGWDVESVDISEQGKSKALQLAEENNVSLNYNVADVLEYPFQENTYDTVVLIYFHIEEESREGVHKRILNSLKPGGRIILLVYEKDHLELKTNGPSSSNMLYSLDALIEDFINLKFDTLVKEKISRIKNGVPQQSIVIKFVGEKV